MLGIGALIWADLHYNRLDTLRSALDTLMTPLYALADVPDVVADWRRTHIVSRGALIESNARLSQENLVLKGRLQQMVSLQADNMRLRALLNSTAILRDDVLVAELMGVSPDPARHQIILDKGARNGVYRGQPLIDADGLMGQVTEVNPTTARVLLITDAAHSVPVQVNRNGVRAVAEGTGSLDSLEVHHVPTTTDIREGDLLVTSGLGRRFPFGYPVAEVTEVRRDPGQTFARIAARPTAALDRSRHVLLVFSAPRVREEQGGG